MKCAKCGTELKQGSMYCSKCGKEVQIVPDYNLMEDDITSYLNGEFSEKNHKKEVKKDDLPGNAEKKMDPKKKKKLILGLSAAGVLLVIIIVLMLLSAHQKNTSFDYQYQRAVDYMNNGLYEKSHASLKKALKIDKNSEKANIALAQLYVYEKEEAEAINILLDVIDMYPESKDAYKLLLSIYEDHGDYASITELCKNIENEEVLKLFANYIVEPPVLEPETGEYDEYITIAINVSDDAQCFYTTNGSDPKKNGKLYTSEIKLPEGTTTIRVVAMNDYNIYSEETEGTYIIKLEVPGKPEASLPSGTYEESEMISIYVPEDCEAYYTWDGSTPTADSSRYTGAFKMPEGNNVLSVIIINENNLSSEVARYNYIYIPQEEIEEE